MKILITPRGFASYGHKEIELMNNKNLVVDYNDTGLAYSYEKFVNKAKDADAIIVGVDLIDKNMLDQCPNLKVICKFGVGTDNIDLEECEKRGIYVGRTVGTNSLSVAEHVISMLFAITKNILPVATDIKNGGWNKPTGLEVNGKTIGIVGYGAIGQILGRISQGLGMNVIAYDAFDISDELAENNNITVVDFDTLIKESDFVSLHVPLTNETENLISKKELEAMKENAILLNAARGGVVNEEDLYTALKNGVIYGAGFDVFSVEPPKKGEALLTLDNFILTSHTAARTIESEQRTCGLSTQIILEKLGVL